MSIENRIIKSALVAIKDHCKEANNWRMANEFSHLLHSINSEPSLDILLNAIGSAIFNEQGIR